MVENDVPRLERSIKARERELQEKIATQKQIQHYIEQLSNPFGFLNKAVKTIEDRIHVQEAEELKYEQKGEYPTAFKKEKELEQIFD
jgi:hypothetical protein